MAVDNAFRLISKVVSDGDLRTVIDRGINPEWFLDDDYRDYYKFILDYFNKYGTVPTRVTFRDNFPPVKLLRVEDPLDYLVDQMVAWRRQQGAARIIKDAAASFDDGDHESALQAMSRGLIALDGQTAVGSSDVDLQRSASTYLDLYEERSRSGGALLGLPTGFDRIDQATAGVQPGQLITIVATPKAGKSTLAMKIAVHMHELASVPLFQSFEMSNREQEDRHHAIRACIAHSRLSRGTLTTKEYDRLSAMLRRLAKLEHAFILSDAAEGLTISAIRSKLSKYMPNVLIVDGVYLMYDEITGERNTPQALTNLTRGFKALAQRAKIPVIITTQALTWKMRGTTLTGDSIGYSSSFFQDSDVILGLQFTQTEEPELRELRIVASRNCGPAESLLLWDWENGKFEEMAA